MKAFLAALTLFACLSFLQPQTRFETEDFRLNLDRQGAVSVLVDLIHNVNYAPEHQVYLPDIKTGGKMLEPVGFEARRDRPLPFLALRPAGHERLRGESRGTEHPGGRAYAHEFHQLQISLK